MEKFPHVEKVFFKKRRKYNFKLYYCASPFPSYFHNGSFRVQNHLKKNRSKLQNFRLFKKNEEKFE